MKKLLLFVAIMLCCAMTMFAQNNNKISYQAVVRDAQNRLVANKSVTVNVNIFNGTETTAAYSEWQRATTNYNGLISLLVGDGTVTAGNWSFIDWKTARIETTVELGGTPIGTLEMPFTAVPYAMYAEYADEIDPEAAVVLGIYNKIKYDSLALGILIDHNATSIGDLQDMDKDLAERIAADSVRLLLFQNKMKADSAALKGLVDANITAINALKTVDANLSQRITTDSNNLVNFKAKVKADSAAMVAHLNDTLNEYIKRSVFCDEVKVCVNSDFSNVYGKIQADSIALSGQINTLANSVDTAKTRIRSEMANLGNNVATTYATKEELNNEISTLNTTITNLQMANNALSARIKADSVALVNYKAKVKQDSIAMDNRVSTLETNLNNLTELVNSLNIKMKQEKFLANAGQTVFTLAEEAKTDCVVRMYINGVMVGGNHNGVVTINNSNIKQVTYAPAENGDYALKANDKVTIVYWY